MKINKNLAYIFVSLFLISLIGISSNPILTSKSSFEGTSNADSVDKLQNQQGISSLPSELVFCGVFPIVQRPDAGPDRRDGFYIAVDEINAQTGSERILPVGVSIKSIALDDGNNAAGGVVAAQTCISQGAHVVIGSSGSSVSAAMQNELKQVPIIQISYASSSPTLSNRTEYPYFMRVIGPDSDQGLAIVDLVDSFGFTKGAIIHQDDLWGSGTPIVFGDNWSGNVTTTQVFSVGAFDVSTQVQNLKDAVENDGARFILLNAFPIETATVIKEAFNVGLTNNENVTFILTDGGTSTSTFASDSDVKDGMQNVLGMIPASNGPNYQLFLDTWNTVSTCSNSTGDSQITCGFARTGLAPNPYTPFAYDATYVAAKGFAETLTSNASFSATPAETDELLDALYGITHEGAGSSVKFNDLGEASANYDYVTLVNDTFDPIGKWDGKLVFTNDSVVLPGGSNWLLFDDVAVGTKTRSVMTINSDSDFALNNFTGSGTVEDPYLLNGYNIANPSVELVSITGTTAHFALRNNLFNGTIRISDSINFAVENNVLINGSIALNNVSNYNVKNNYLDGLNGQFDGISVSDSLLGSISNNQITNLLQSGIGFEFSNNNTVVERNMVYNTGAGIRLAGFNNTIRYNSIHHTNTIGIFTEPDNSNNHQIIGNEIYNNTELGILLEGANHNQITANRIFNNGLQGIGIGDWGFGGSTINNSVNDNILDGNIQGIRLFLANDNKISNNEVFDHTFTGIAILSSNMSHISDNNIYRNNIGIGGDSALDGFISFNIISENRAQGIWFDNSENYAISNNSIYSNSINEIEFVNSNLNSVEFNDISGTVSDGGLNNIFSKNHYAGWLSSNPYSFTGNQDLSPRSVPYHITEPSLSIPSAGTTVDNEVNI
ncbi:MAG: ABC transporter substrate-binding protein, partial [Candidatus Hodarchaeales archaeon]